MKKSMRNVILGSAATAAGAAVTSHFTTKYLMKIAMDREAPKNLYRKKQQMKGSRELMDFMEEMNLASEKLMGCSCEAVEITGHNGVPLVGHWRPCRHPRRVIIAMHGWRSSWARDFGIIADFWYENDCSVLYAEQRGQGDSGGEYMGFGLLERYDCLEWIKWVNEYTGGSLPIYLGGASMGATTVLMAASLELPENVKGIVADCGFTSPYAIWKHVIENNLHLPYSLYRASANDLCRKRIQLDGKAYSTVDALQECWVPVLFIHGTDDKFVPVEMTYENYKACASPKRLFVVPGADHGMSYYIDREGYEKCLKDFWKEYDGNCAQYLEANGY